MKPISASLFLFLLLSTSIRADLTITQKLEGAGPVSELTVKVKGDKARVEATPQLTTIVDTKTGEMVNLMKDRKIVVRLSADKMKAATEMMNRYARPEQKGPAARLEPTGKREKINGYDTEEYIYETPGSKVSYWVAPNYPHGSAILKELQSLDPRAWMANSANIPNYRDLPGLPIRTVISTNGKQITTTITSIEETPLSESEFVVPPDYHELKIPQIDGLLKEQEKEPATSSSP